MSHGMELSNHRVMKEKQLIQPGDRLLVGVSGGPDSMALLHWLWQHKEEFQLADLQAIHVHHQLRGVEADEDLSLIHI